RPGAVPVGLQLYDRVFLVPDAKALVVLTGSADKVVMHRLDVDELVRASGTEVLAVTSRPDPATRGRPFAYAPKVLSKAGGVRLKLDAGPDGMKLDGDRLTWAVP